MVWQLTQARYSARRIAVRLGISPRQVVRYRNGKVNGRSNRLTEDEIARRRKIVLARYGAYSTQEIADEVGVAHSTIGPLISSMRREGVIGCCHLWGCPNQRGGDCEFAR